MRKLLGHQVGHRDIEEIIRDVDLNGDGRVDFEGRGVWKRLSLWVHPALPPCLSFVLPVYTPIHLPSPSCIHLADHLYLSLARLSICPDAWSVFHHL